VASAVGFTVINGLPAHVLLVHVVVIILPLAALGVVLAAWWPAARHKLGFLPLAAAAVALVFVPLTTHAGEWLKERVFIDASVRRHAELGDELLPWAIGLFLIAAILYGVHFWRTRLATDAGAGGSTGMRVATTIVPAVLATVLAVGCVVQVYRIGDSGAKAVWQNTSKTPIQQPTQSAQIP
jgi:hypothetical protein